ncbi:MAG: hypothetical protein HYR97_03300, partial [Candidatus Melainabacteria bacterium]|nr:hypothetical protein [Candidatus Melainabacteria bacterium]
YPYSTSIIFPLAEIIYDNTGNLEEPEQLILKAFKYFPYDNMTLEALIKIYGLKEDMKKYAHYSYVAGIRKHSTQKLRNAEVAYFYIKELDNMKLARKKIDELENRSNVQ